METLEHNKIKIFKALFVLIVILSAYFAVKIFKEVEGNSILLQAAEPATVSFSGHGEVTAVPDIANISLTLRKESSTAKEAQENVATKEKRVLDFLKGKNVDEKDIKTVNASVYPKYEYQKYPGVSNECRGDECYYGGKQVLIGYEASESINIKVRKVDDAGAIMQGLGDIGVSDLNGPNYAIDNEDGLKAEARKKAIDEAKEKAKVLAKDLGIRLGKIKSFSETGNYYPIMYGKAEMMDSAGSSAPAPAELPKGENTVSSDVTITYEIK